MSKIKNGGLDQHGAEPFEQKQFGTAGVEGVNLSPDAAERLLPVVFFEDVNVYIAVTGSLLSTTYNADL